MKRILHIIGAMNVGGAETMIMNFYRNIDRSKYQFDFVMNTQEKCFYQKEIEELGGKIYYVKKYKWYEFAKCKREWLKFFKEHDNFYVIEGHIGSISSLYSYAAKKTNNKIILHAHSSDEKFKFTIKDIMWKTNGLISRHLADYFVACSKQSGIDRYGKKIVNSNKFSIVNNGVDAEKMRFNQKYRDQIRKELKINDDTVVFGHVGRFIEIKNHKFLLKVFYEYHKINNNSRLLLIGDGKLREEIEKEISNLCLNEDVILLGIRDDVNKILSAMDIFIFPSKLEGLGISVIEAQASGLNVFCSDTVPEETKISNLIQYLPLSLGEKQWSNKILETKINHNRDCSYKCLIEHDFDIVSATNHLVDIYEGVING